jgi:hypothetical protein
MKRIFPVAPFLLTMASALEAAETSRAVVIDQTIATLQRVQTFERVAIAPDGKHMAWIQTVRDGQGKPAFHAFVALGLDI